MFYHLFLALGVVDCPQLGCFDSDVGLKRLSRLKPHAVGMLELFRVREETPEERLDGRQIDRNVWTKYWGRS
jgi:hypothetical protein